ncbi:MAG: hypothetical protein ABI333_26065 [bacterium]
MKYTISTLCTLAMLFGAGCKTESAGPCDGITCSGHGSCVEAAGEAACECELGYEPEGLHCIDPSSTTQTTDQIVQYGIAWTFDDQVPYGRYANGDYWVQGPVTIVRIAPDAAGDRHGWEVNPADIDAQGFDARIASYEASRIPTLPYVAQPGESVVKSISLSPLDDEECRPCLLTAAVLTVVAVPPPDQGATVFRPPYFGAAKPNYSTNELNTDLLPTLDATGDPPGLDDIVSGFRRVQLDHKVNWTGRPMHPQDNLPDYGSSIASRNAEGALRLMLSETADDKWDALIHYVQYGIDLYHMVQGGVYWPPGGGHGEGRRLPLTFASVLLDDADMQAAVSDSASSIFGEGGGMHYFAPADTVLFGQTWNDEDHYWTNLVFDTGSRTIPDPYGYIDGGHVPGGSYQFCCTSLPWKSTATALYLMPELIPVWNYQPFFDYVNRWVSFGAWSQPDPCAPPDGGTCQGGDNAGAPCTTASAPTVCTGDEASCDTTVSYDTNYGVTYGPDGNGGCIPDTDPSDGIGRFPLLHGTSTDDGHYGSAFANAMWSAYYAAP